MIKKLLFWIFITVFSTIGFGLADRAGYTIDSFDVQIDLNTDGSAQIEESILVDFSEPRHGIYRDIPISIENSNLTIDTILSNKNINKISTSNNILSIQLWDANREITGKHTYNITYTVRNIIKTFQWKDELYRNMIGNQRNTSIDKTTWTINLPQDYLSFTGSSWAVWWWYGAQNTGNILFTQTQPTQRRGELNTPLQAKQGVTVWLQFSWNYFNLPANYDNYFVSNTINQDQSSSFRNKILIYVEYIINFLPFLFTLVVFGIIGVGSKINSPRKSKKPIVTQYEPPKNIDPAYAFYLRYNNKAEPKMFTGLVYYRATQWRITIKKEKKEGMMARFGQKEQYSLVETSLRPDNTSPVDDSLLQQFFGKYDAVLDEVILSESSYSKIQNLLSRLEKEFKWQWFTKKKQGAWWKLWMKELTPVWSETFEQLRWYKQYLQKVEQPVIEQELKSDPEYLNKILPWAVLFWVETRLLKIMEEVIKNIQRYQTNDGTYLTAHTLSNMNKTFANYSVPPRSSGSSGFSGGGWFSWGGGWWGWGWSR